METTQQAHTAKTETVNRFDAAFPVRQLGLNDQRDMEDAYANRERKFRGAGKLGRLAKYWGIVDTDTQQINAAGVAGVEANNLLRNVWDLIPYKAKMYTWNPKGLAREAGNVADKARELWGDEAADMYREAADYQRNAASRWQKRNGDRYAGGDLFDANRGVYDLSAQITFAGAVVEALDPKQGHAAWCEAFLGL